MLTARLLLALCRRASPCPALSWGGCACRGIEPRLEPFTLRAMRPCLALPCRALPCLALPCRERGVLGVEPKRRPSPLPNRKVPLPCLVRPCLGLSCHTRPHPETWAFGSRTRTKTISPTAPEDALASPRRASPCQASHRQASSAPAVGIEPTVQPFGLPAARATPCHASPRPATPGLATPCLTPSVLVGGVEPPIRPSELPATPVAPCLAQPSRAMPRRAAP